MKKSWITIGENNEEIFKALEMKEFIALEGKEAMEYQKDKFDNDVAPMKEQIETLKALVEKGEEEGKEEAQKSLDTLKVQFEAIEKWQNEMLIQVKANSEKGGSNNGEKVGLIEKHIMSEEFQGSLDGKKAGFHKLALKAPEVMSVGTTTIPSTPSVVGSTDGFSTILGNFVDTEIGKVPKPENFILPLVSVTTQPGTDMVWWTERNNEEGDAQFIGEGDLKPLVSAKWETFSEKTKEVADRWKMTNRLMKHASSVVNEFREHATELVEQKIDDQLVTGDGLGNNLKGISECASAFVVPPQLALCYIDANIWDVINATLITVKLANFNPSVIVLNTVWEAKMKSIKAVDGTYLVPPFVTPDGQTISGVRVVFTNKLDDAKIIVGDLKKYRVVFSENIMYETGWENDDFSKNLTSHKLEAFLLGYCKSTDTGAIIMDDIATILTAIDKP